MKSQHLNNSYKQMSPNMNFKYKVEENKLIISSVSKNSGKQTKEVVQNIKDGLEADSNTKCTIY